MKVLFVARMPAFAYSGGRLATLTYAESMAANGAEVELWTDNIPRMAREFSTFSRVKMRLRDLDNIVSFKGFDAVILVPHMGKQDSLIKWARLAEGGSTETALLCFETPNWFNRFALDKRPDENWLGWRALGNSVSRVISLSREGQHYAEEYFSGAACKFHFVYPSINSRLADRSKRKLNLTKRILMLTRVDGHKGLRFVEHLVSPELEGTTLRIHLGNGKIPDDDANRIREMARASSVRVQIRGAAVGVQKFSLIKNSDLLFFPTDFEGFGIPPLEAAYVGTRALVSDLPVLREFGGEGFSFFENEKKAELPQRARKAMESRIERRELDRLRSLGQFERAGAELIEIFTGRS